MWKNYIYISFNYTQSNKWISINIANKMRNLGRIENNNNK